ncbi:unnamed protein product, partial [Caenorhabditis brenneri]
EHCLFQNFDRNLPWSQTVFATKIWIENVYTEWSQLIANATEDQNFKFCSDANELERKFEASNQALY